MGDWSALHAKRFHEMFNTHLTPVQSQGFVHVLNRAKMGVVEAHMAQIAYILATAYWESGLSFCPVREGLAQTDQAARDYVTGLYDSGRIKINYAQPAENGQSFYGRGYVQLTWEKNYRAMGMHILGDETWLYHAPDLVLDPNLSAIILVRGMIDGLFGVAPLRAYINEHKTDFVGARYTVNGQDRAETLALWARRMLYVLTGRLEI